LVSVRGNAHLSLKKLENDFDKHMKAKANLCKLPLVDLGGGRNSQNDSTKILSSSKSKAKLRGNHRKNILSIQDPS